MSGRFAMKRGWRENALFRNEPFNKACAWVWMIERACFQATKFDINGKIITLQRSQFCSSIRQLADEWGWSKSAVDRFLTRLKTETMIETDVGTGKLIITICNYDKHQFEPKYSGTHSGTQSGTGAGQERDTKEEGNKEISYKDNTDVLSSVISGDDDLAQSPIPALPKIQSSEIDEAVACWNMAAAQTGWPAIRALGPDRQNKLAARLKENGLEGWKEALRKAFRSEQLGRDPPSWFSFPWLIANANNILKVLEGNYDKRFGTSGGNGNRQNQPDTGPVDPMVKAHLARESRRAGQQQPEFFGDDAGGWPEVGSGVAGVL